MRKPTRPAAPSPAAPSPAAARPEAYRSPLAVLAWWLWLACAVAILIDIAVQEDGRSSVAAAAAVLTITAIVYVAALHPRIIAAAEGVVIRNPLREHRVAWRTVSAVDLRDLLRVHCAWQEAADPHRGHGDSAGSLPETGQRTRVIQAWALQSPRRTGVVAKRRAAIGRGSPARQSAGGQAVSQAGAAEPLSVVRRRESERIATALAERARQEHARAAARAAETDRPGMIGTGEAAATEWPGEANEAGEAEWPARPVSAWTWPAVLAVVIPALLLIVTILA